MEDKIGIDPNEEVVIRCADLLNLVQGLSEFGNFFDENQKKLSEEENHRAMIILLSLFVCVAKLFPRGQRDKIFDEIEKDLGVPVRELVHW